MQLKVLSEYHQLHQYVNAVDGRGYRAEAQGRIPPVQKDLVDDVGYARGGACSQGGT